MSRTRVGLIGCGFIGSRHLRNLVAFPDVDVVAVMDVCRDRRSAAGQLARARTYGSHAEMLGGEELDCVFICVPPFAHGDPETVALARGLPFFVEKPLAADLAVAERIAQRVRDLGVVTAVGYHWRYLDIVETARELLDGTPARLVLGRWLDETPPPPWWIVERQSGGQFVEQATHLFDLVRMLVGEVETVYAAGSKTARPGFPASDILDVSTATLNFTSGAVGTISSTCLLHWLHRVTLEIIGEGLALELTETDLLVQRAGDRWLHQEAADPFVREDRDFIDAVQGKPNRVRAPYAEALLTHRLAIGAARSAHEGRPVAVSPPVDVGRG